MPYRKQPVIDFGINEADIRVYTLFTQTAFAVQKHAETSLHKRGLSPIQFIVLKTLDFNKGRMIPSEIARWTVRENHNITTLVRRLQRDGLVDMEKDRADQRLIWVILTEKGRQVLKSNEQVSIDIVKQIMATLSENDIDTLEKNLLVLRSNAFEGLRKFKNKLD